MHGDEPQFPVANQHEKWIGFLSTCDMLCQIDCVIGDAFVLLQHGLGLKPVLQAKTTMGRVQYSTARELV